MVRGIHVSSTALRLTGVNNRSVVTTGSEFAIFVRNGATFTVANGDLFVEATGANALDVYGSTIEMTGAGSVIKATNGVGLIMRHATLGPAGVAMEAVVETGAENGVVVGLVGGDGALIIGPDAPDSVFGDGGVIASSYCSGTDRASVSITKSWRRAAFPGPRAVMNRPRFYRRPVASFHATISSTSRCA